MAVLLLACTPAPKSSKSQADDTGSPKDVLTEPSDIEGDSAPGPDDGTTGFKDTSNGLADIPIDVGFEVGDGSVGQSCFLDKHCIGDGLCLD
ncbi:MAG TPA: hypothetical protein EYN66_22330, partial [Myxococcales bacterium]|nr:hypothetical protein [Myxococcales bacterium]